MSYNFNNPPIGTGGPVIRWLVGAVQFLSRQLNGIAINGGGGTGSRYLTKQVFDTPVTVVTYIAPARVPFTVGATLTGDADGSGTIQSVNDVDGAIYLVDATDFSRANLTYTDSAGGDADSTGDPGQVQADVTVSNTTDILYYDPPHAINVATIGLPNAPHDGQVLFIYYGGSIAKDGIAVIAIPTIKPANKTTLIANNHAIKASVGTPSKVIYREDIDAWYIT